MIILNRFINYRQLNTFHDTFLCDTINTAVPSRYSRCHCFLEMPVGVSFSKCFCFCRKNKSNFLANSKKKGNAPNSRSGLRPCWRDVTVCDCSVWTCSSTTLVSCRYLLVPPAPHPPLPEREFPHFHNFIYVQSAAALLSPPINSSGNSVWRQSVSPWCVCGTRTMVRLLFLVLYASEFKLMISLKAIKKKKSCSAPCPCSEPALVNPQDVNDSRSGLCRLISKEAS